jgi:MoaA/NifB/PqqE/SkfB family radical SAM enzyme
MNTNGTLLKRSKASQIAKAFDVIAVSIDGPKEIHDKIRGVTGIYQKSIEAVKLLRACGVKVGVNTVISPWNVKVLPHFVEELRSLVDFVQVQPIHPYHPPPENRPPPQEILRLQEYLLKLKSEDPGFLAVPADFIRGFRLFFEGKAPKICHAGKLYVAVDPSGRLLACGARGDVVLGSLLEHSADVLLRREVKSDGWLNVASCRGCWLECTVGVSMTIGEPLKEARYMAGYLKRL